MNDLKKTTKICKYFEGYKELYTPFNEEEYTVLISNIKELLSLDIQDIVYSIAVRSDVHIESFDVPVFSDFDDCTINICEILDSIRNEKELGWEKLGEILQQKKAKKMAFYKYGETHYKTACLLGLVTSKNDTGPIDAAITNIGYYYLTNENDRIKLLTRLILRTKIVQKLIKESISKPILASAYFGKLSAKTKNRRMPNVKKLMSTLFDTDEYDFLSIKNNITFDRIKIEK